MTVRGIVLSRTEMSGGTFCGCAAIDLDGTWEQVRLLSSQGTHLHPSLFGVASESVRGLWRPGRIIRLPNPTRSDPRPTHPEDRLVDPSRIKFGAMADAARFSIAAAAFTFDSVGLLFPNVVWQENGKAYARGDRALPRSVGYVPCERLTILEDEFVAVRVAGGEKILCKVKSEIFLEKIRDGRVATGSAYPARLVRLGLANPTDWDGRFDPARCYVMLTGIVR